jgi:hypothetical protein
MRERKREGATETIVCAARPHREKDREGKTGGGVSRSTSNDERHTRKGDRQKWPTGGVWHKVKKENNKKKEKGKEKRKKTKKARKETRCGHHLS